MKTRTPDMRAGTTLTRASLAERTGSEAPPPPVRIVHLGLGAFARAHQAWYTSQVDESGEWGIAAFTGRSATVAAALAPQGGLFTLIERSAIGDEVSVVGSIVEVADGADVPRLVELLAAPPTAVVTITITEPGYRLRPDGSLDTDDPVVVSDVRLVRAALGDADGTRPTPQSALARLVLGLDARRSAGGGPLAVVPCDNMPDNGAYVRRGVLEFAASVSPELHAWIEENVSFVATSVDRITPRTTAADIVTVQEETGWLDAAPVVTEPFHDWILCGSFPAGRPQWERAGARFVDDIEPFERRKLWLLNGAHSLLAYLGLQRGHRTVAQAIADPLCRQEVLAFWAEATRHLPSDGLDLDAYQSALLDRFENARIEHLLAQIAGEGVMKLRVRIVPVARAERAAGRPAAGSAVAIGAWIAAVLAGRELDDVHIDAVRAAASATDPEGELLALIDPQLALDTAFASAIRVVVSSLP